MNKPIIEKIRVRYGETDAMGHAYYGSYLLWFEQARGAWCRARNFDYRDMEAIGIFLPCVEAHLRYKAEIRYDEVISVKVWVSEMRRASIRFDYVIHREDGTLATEGYTWHVTMSTERKAVTIPPAIHALLDRDPEPVANLNAEV
jgi:acyl-CoA thioester hydrolase